MVTGTYEPIALEEVDRAVVVLPAREHALVLNSLVELLQLDPSLDLRQRAPGGIQADLSIRGSSYGQTLVLLNGLRLNDVQSGHHNMDIPIPLAGVTRIEVLRGSGSTLYGSDAVGGAINIITEPPREGEIRLRTAIGNFGINQQRGSLAGTWGNFSQQLIFSRDVSAGFRSNREYRNLQLASTTRVTTSLGASSLTVGYMDHPFGADQFYGNANSWERTKTMFVGFQQSLGKKTTTSFAYRRHTDLFVLFRDHPQDSTNRHVDDGYQFALRRHETVRSGIDVYYGAEGLHDAVASSNLGNHSRSRAATYAAVDFRALRRFSLSLAAREELYRSVRGQFSPALAGGVWLSPRLKLRASASRAFRLPTYTELYYHDLFNLGSSNLRPESVWTYESGVDWHAHDRIRAGLTLFHRRERNGIDYFRTSPNDIWRAFNIQNLNFTGVEASIRILPARSQNIDLRYTGLRGVQNVVPNGFTKYTFSYPTHSGTVGWQGTFRGGFMARTRIGVMDRRARGSYAVWDLSAAYSRSRVRPFVQFFNLTSTSYQEIVGVAMPTRTVLAGLEVVLRGR